MSFRFMRVLVFFDLPRDTAKQRKVATDFVKNLTKNGFLMLQESVYCKLVLNANNLVFVKEHLDKCKPNEGVVTMLTVTEKQFSEMVYLVGKAPSATVNSTDRVVRI